MKENLLETSGFVGTVGVSRNDGMKEEEYQTCLKLM